MTARRRLFIALDLADDVRQRLDRALAGRRTGTEWRWTRPESWHLTLAFLGDVYEEPSDVASVAGAATALAPARIDLRLGSHGNFRQRVVWYGVEDEPAGAVRHLGEGVQEVLDAEGVPVDRKPVRPHVTVARVRGRRAGRCDLLALPDVDASWSVAEAVLYESHLEPDGARYEALATMPLGGS